MIQTWLARCTASRGSRPAASSRLVTIMVRLLSHRSTNTPASELSAICGTNEASSITADASVEPVST